MDIQGSRPLTVARQQAWDMLNDPEILKRCIPGCETMEATDATHYLATMALRVGPVAAKFNGKLELRDIQPPESYAIAFDGQGGVAGFGKGQARVRLEDAEAGPGCVLHYTAHATVGGKIAQIGQRLVEGAARSLTEEFFKRFDHEVQSRYPAPTGAVAASAATTAPALRWLWLLAAAIAIALLVWVWQGYR